MQIVDARVSESVRVCVQEVDSMSLLLILIFRTFFFSMLRSLVSLLNAASDTFVFRNPGFLFFSWLCKYWDDFFPLGAHIVKLNMHT